MIRENSEAMESCCRPQVPSNKNSKPSPLRADVNDGDKGHNILRKSAVSGLRSRRCYLNMHLATIVLLLFCVSCIAVNIGQLVPIFATDGGQLGQRHSLQELLGAATSALPKDKPATAHHHPTSPGIDLPASAGNGASTVKRTRTFTRTYFGDSDEVFLCDRSNCRGDVCYLRGALQMHGEVPSIVLHTKKNSTLAGGRESIQPLARKWEPNTMRRVENISITSQPKSAPRYKCDVHHSKPAIVFSTGGFTGNVYHDFNDILIPLFITSQHYRGEVVLVVTEHRAWWWSRYARLLKQLSRYRMINLQADSRAHCYPEAIVGLLIHGELMVDPARMPYGETIHDFQEMLARAYDVSRLGDNKAATKRRGLGGEAGLGGGKKKALLVLILRRRSRVLLNHDQVAGLARDLGFEVRKMAPGRTMDLRTMYQVLHAADAVMGVHGAALTHLLFMRRGSVFIQIVPLGTRVPAAQYYGEPAVRCGLHYLQYDIAPEESSLLDRFPRNHPAVSDPGVFAAQGWNAVKEIYLDDQNVQPDLRRLSKVLRKAQRIIISDSPPVPDLAS